jgi:hypothetical protein
MLVLFVAINVLTFPHKVLKMQTHISYETFFHKETNEEGHVLLSGMNADKVQVLRFNKETLNWYIQLYSKQTFLNDWVSAGSIENGSYFYGMKITST